MATSQLPANFYFRQGRIEIGPGILMFDARWEFVVNRANKLGMSWAMLKSSWKY